MADPASIVLGVIPIVAVAFKSYAAVSNKFSTFIHYSATVKRLQKLFKVQRQVFENECHILLCFTLDDEVVRRMKDDPNHSNWVDGRLDRELRDQIGESYECCLEIIGDIQKAVADVEKQLGEFEVLTRYQLKGEKLKRTIKRLQGRVEITINESRYEKVINEVKSGNSNLTSLREQITALRGVRQAPTRNKSPAAAKMEGWETVCSMRQASKGLYGALTDGWSCGEANHLRHLFKLFIAPDISEDMWGRTTHMSLAVISPHTNGGIQQARLLPLLVKYQKQIPRPLSPPRDSEREQPKKRVKVVSFADDPRPLGSVRTSRRATEEYIVPIRSGPTQAKDICSSLSRGVPASGKGISDRYLGHIDSKSGDLLRYSFYPQPGSIWSELYKGVVGDDDFMSMDALLAPETTALLTPIDKFRLARSLVEAVLQFHSTPWMKDVWRLGDLAFFRHGEDIQAALETLHLGVDFVKGNIQQRTDSLVTVPTPEGVLLTPPHSDPDSSFSQMTPDDQLRYGIHNLPLHCLGVALLQIDRWSFLDPEDVLSSRKQAMRPSSLSPRFLDMIQKCLRCDFGYGTDLDRPQLRKAVYDNLVGSLDHMIRCLDLEDGKQV